MIYNVKKGCKIGYIRVLFLGFFVFSFSGCVASLDRGNFSHIVVGHLSTPSFYGYKIIDTEKEKFSPKPPYSHIIERFEVRDGDCGVTDGWSDCANDRERYELKEDSHSRDTHDGSEYWYTWSIYFPNDYINIYPTKTCLGQFHQTDSHPVWMFQNQNKHQNIKGGYWLDNQVAGYTTKYYKLIDEKDLRGKWHTIVLHVKWSRDSKKGFFKVWVDGRKKVDYHGKTMSASEVYFKYGIYRSFLNRYKNAKQREWMDTVQEGDKIPDYKDIPKVKIPTQVVYYSNVKRANTKKELFLGEK